MTAALRRKGDAINHKRGQQLMQVMGLQAIYPKPMTTVAVQGQQVYPYLLRGLEIRQPKMVWSADITSVPMAHGFMYLVAIIDKRFAPLSASPAAGRGGWFSRYVLAWPLSNTLEGRLCLEALQQALLGQPAIFHTDRDVQFTALAFTACLAAAGIRTSMDGRGRALDNVFIERLWRSLKYETLT